MINTQECPCECGGMCLLNSDLDSAEARIQKLETALKRICDTPFVVYEPVRQIAREALE